MAERDGAGEAGAAYTNGGAALLKRLTDAEIAELLAAYAAIVNDPAALPSADGTVVLPTALTMPLAAKALFVLPSLLDEVQRWRTLMAREKWELLDKQCPRCGGPVQHRPGCTYRVLRLV